VTERGRRILKLHEALRLKPYDDATGKPLERGSIVEGAATVGWGHNLTDRGINQTTAEQLLTLDIQVAEADLFSLVPDAESFSPARRDALINLSFALGRPRLEAFRKMLAAVRKLDWNTAADELLNSRWAVQVDARARQLAQMFRTGDYPVI
jgi:lysozyme